jgi:hypothetical protein
MALRRRVPTLLALACTAALLLSGCGEEADLRTDRPDVTASPPPDGNHVAQPATKKNTKATRKKHPRKAPVVRWVRVTDRASSISFLLPSDVDPAVTPLPVAGAVQRTYLSAPGDGSQVMVAVADIPGARTLDVDGAIAGATGQLRQQGATEVQARGRRTLSVAGHQAAEFELTFSQGSAAGFAVFRLVRLDGGFLLAGVAAPATGVEAQARRDSLRLQARLNDGLRLG